MRSAGVADTLKEFVGTDGAALRSFAMHTWTIEHKNKHVTAWLKRM
jgi:hypothetical protein